MVAVLESLRLGDPLSRSLDITEDQKQHLVMLYDTLIASEEVDLGIEGTGRLNVQLGDYYVITLVTEGSGGNRRRILDPFNPMRRGDYQLIRQTENGSFEQIHWATVYESLQDDDFGRALNLHLDSIADAYDALADRKVALSIANQMVLKLLAAADESDETMREYLLSGAKTLTDWLVLKGDGEVTYKINRWQTLERIGDLSAEDQLEMRKARRDLRGSTDEDAYLREACLTILLKEFDELNVMLSDMAVVDTERLRGWPIWFLASRRASD
jgi:hypothetical protein